MHKGILPGCGFKRHVRVTHSKAKYMSFQLLSDLHLERAPFKLIKHKSADYLILAGDIGDPASIAYLELIEIASPLYVHIFIIKGNHECWGRTLLETDDLIGSIAAKMPNVTYLNKSDYDLPGGMRIIGATLWSYVIDAQRPDVQCFIADYRYIKDWNIDKNNLEYCKTVAYLKEEIAIAKAKGQRLIVVTHHAPAIEGTSPPLHDKSRLKSAYASDLTSLFTSIIAVWCHGHTHHSHIQHIKGTTLVSNQRGLPDEDTKFVPSFMFRVGD